MVSRKGSALDAEGPGRKPLTVKRKLKFEKPDDNEGNKPAGMSNLPVPSSRRFQLLPPKSGVAEVWVILPEPEKVFVGRITIIEVLKIVSSWVLSPWLGELVHHR
jgi:hypothetical protein